MTDEIAAAVEPTPAPAPVAETPAVAPSEDDALGAMYDKLTADEPAQAEPVQDETPPTAETVIEAPPGIPGELKEIWGKLDDDARTRITKSHNSLASKLATQGRLVQGIAPIRDVLVEAARDIPEMANMRPEDVATDVMELARVSAAFKRDPVGTLLGYADRHNLRGQLQQALGQPVTAQPQGDLSAKFAAMEKRIAELSDPSYIANQVSTVTTQERLTGEVQQFAATVEHWDDLEGHIPSVIPLAQSALGEGASAKDVLAKAYEIALATFMPHATVAAKTSQPAQKAADPGRAKAAEQAKSVNVPGRGASAPAVLSEDAELAAIYDRASRK